MAPKSMCQPPARCELAGDQVKVVIISRQAAFGLLNQHNALFLISIPLADNHADCLRNCRSFGNRGGMSPRIMLHKVSLSIPR